MEKAVLRDMHGGGTILLHDSDCTSATGSWRTTLRALPRILDVCHQHDWQVGPLREHGVPGLPGQVSDGRRRHLSHPVNGRAERDGRGSVSSEATS
ncbi:hypothetical protein ACWDFL_03325 [Streptomyces bungoensis]